MWVKTCINISRKDYTLDTPFLDSTQLMVQVLVSTQFYKKSRIAFIFSQYEFLIEFEFIMLWSSYLISKKCLKKSGRYFGIFSWMNSFHGLFHLIIWQFLIKHEKERWYAVNWFFFWYSYNAIVQWFFYTFETKITCNLIKDNTLKFFEFEYLIENRYNYYVNLSV